MPTQAFAIDAAAGLIKREMGSAAVTASGYVGTQWDQGADVVTDAILVLNVEAVDIANNDETYTVTILGSQTADRSDGEILAQTTFGAAAAVALETRDAADGDRHTLRFRTEKNETFFRYIDLHLAVAGTTPSITYGAYFSKEVHRA